MTHRFLFTLALCCLAGPGGAFEPALPVGAKETAERSTVLDVFDAPLAGFDGAQVPVLPVEGRITRRSWRIETPGLTPLQVIAPLRAQLIDQGYELAFECTARACGGFDFRFAIEVLPGPNMYVNISRFYYVTGLAGPPDDPARAVGILASVTEGSAYLQIITADKTKGGAPAPVTPSQPVVDLAEPGVVEDLGQVLLTRGRVVLSDLDFATGTSDLGPGPFASLEHLGQVLSQDATLRIALVGHTDTVGGFGANTSISRARARSVRDRLVRDYGIDAARLEAEGVAYLAPVVSNRTAEGRAENRRVEAILLTYE